MQGDFPGMIPDQGTGGISTSAIDDDEFERSLQPGKMIEKTPYPGLLVQHRGDDADHKGQAPRNFQTVIHS